MRKVHVAIWGVHQMIMFCHLGRRGGSKFSKNWPHGLRMTPYPEIFPHYNYCAHSCFFNSRGIYNPENMVNAKKSILLHSL